MNDEKNNLIDSILIRCSEFMDKELLNKLDAVLSISLHDYMIQKSTYELTTDVRTPNEKYLQQFLALKKISGCSNNTLRVYDQAIRMMLNFVNKPIPEITTDDIRYFLAIKMSADNCSNTYLDNIRRYLESFFKTMRIEGYIQNDPIEKISRIKTDKIIRKPFSDMELEILRKTASKDPRMRAIVEFLSSTGCRVSECSGANRTDIQGDKMIIMGKGRKERYVYLNARAIVAIKDYLDTRSDNNPALFVSSKRDRNTHDFERLSKGAIESIIRHLGKEGGVTDCHPHRFRRTTATQALRNGMPIEQVSLMLGHEKITTTQIYARSEDSDVYASHLKYVR